MTPFTFYLCLFIFDNVWKLFMTKNICKEVRTSKKQNKFTTCFRLDAKEKVYTNHNELPWNETRLWKEEKEYVVSEENIFRWPLEMFKNPVCECVRFFSSQVFSVAPLDYIEMQNSGIKSYGKWKFYAFFGLNLKKKFYCTRWLKIQLSPWECSYLQQISSISPIFSLS